jgi:nucleoside-diphosphate-sugar epimerase
VVHSASALPSYPAKEIHSVTVEGTRTVLAQAAALSVPRVIHMSSAAVYGLPKTVPTPETYGPAPVDRYSRAKAQAEQVALEFRTQGMVLPILRPKTFVGPGRLGLFAMLFEWADEARNFPVLGSGNVRTQMLDVDDLVEAVLLTASAPEEVVNDTFNVGATEFGTLREAFQTVLDAAGHGKRVVSVPDGPAVAVLALLDRTGLSPVYPRLMHKLRADSYVTTDRIQDRLGFKPAHSNDSALLRTYRWWRERPAEVRRARAGVTSRQPWKQGALALAKAAF